MSNFSFSHSVFKRLVLQTHKKQGLFGKGLKMQKTLKTLNLWLSSVFPFHERHNHVSILKRRNQKEKEHLELIKTSHHMLLQIEQFMVSVVFNSRIELKHYIPHLFFKPEVQLHCTDQGQYSPIILKNLLNLFHQDFVDLNVTQLPNGLAN